MYIDYIQPLSEEFIQKNQYDVNWSKISQFQKLSEEFISEFRDKVNWDYISQFQKLSEEFIREFRDKVNWSNISQCQKLSKEFIREFRDKVNWDYISYSQKLSEEFIREFNLEIPKNNWLYKDREFKLNYLKKIGKYEIIDDYIIAYKSTREDGSSCYNFQYKYEIGNSYESHCDCNIDNENSFGLSAWTKEKALEYYGKGKLFKVKINIDDIGAIVQDDGKIRCFKLEILEEITI